MLSHICWFGINASVKVFVSKQKTKVEVSDCLNASIQLRLSVSSAFFIGVTIFFDYLEQTGRFKNLHVLLYGAGALVKNLFLITLAEYGGYLVFSVVAVVVLKNNTGILAGYVMSGIFTALFGNRVDQEILYQWKGGKKQLQTVAEGDSFLYIASFDNQYR